MAGIAFYVLVKLCDVCMHTCHLKCGRFRVHQSWIGESDKLQNSFFDAMERNTEYQISKQQKKTCLIQRQAEDQRSISAADC